MTETSTPVCYRHPDRPTRLSCTQCGRPICVDCSNDAAVGQKCPECSASSGRHRVIDARRTTGMAAGFNGAPVSQTIVYVTAAIYLVGFLSGDVELRLLQDWALISSAVADGEIWRLLSHALLHASPMHILFNMYALYLFGPSLERRVGSVPFAAFYLAAAAAGGAAFVLLREEGLAVGASGAIFGLFGAWVFAGWKMRHTPSGRAQFNQLAVLLAINLALPLFIPRVAWEAHVGGLVAGMAIAWAWQSWAGRSGSPVRDRALIATGVLVLSLLVGALA
jgi:membrane associated rhomboid family serine protease